MSILYDSPTIVKYKNTMKDCIKLYYNDMDEREINKVLDYSISKRFRNTDARVENSYTNKTANMTLLEISDYIASREPIVTAFGTMFRKHADVPNPLGKVVQSFLDLRSEHKKMMFKYPKGSEDFEKYNLLQQLDKIDCNGIYGTIGMYVSLLYNNNVATSITSQGRALVSSMTLFFEMFLANNVKFGSLNEVIEFINNVVKEKPARKFNDFDILDKSYVNLEDCFAKIVLACGYRWIPSEKELDIIWDTLANLSREDLCRVYYKNNLYEFMSNSKVLNLVTGMVKKLKRPMLNSLKVPEEIQEDMALFSDLLFEYVYYHYMYIDRTDRCDNMIKSVTMVSDTDSTIISLDAWYRFIVEQLNGQEIRIANYCPNPIMFMKKNEDGEWDSTEWRRCVKFEPKKLDYNFLTDEIVEMEHQSRPDILTPNDNVRYSIINIMAFVLDRLVNDYMERFCINNHSLTPGRDCRIIAKNEYTFARLMMTTVKKNYTSLITVQEGNMVPYDKQLDVKGIAVLHKSSSPLSTRKALQKILLEDILRAPVIDQLRFIKDMAILEKQIVTSIESGSKEFFKPVTVKAMSAYENPMRIQGVKSSYAWNLIKSNDLPSIDLNERNPVDIVKVNISKANANIIAESYPEVYNNILNTLEQPEFAKGIDAIAIPMDVNVPDWMFKFIDYTEIINNNIGGFPVESIGIQTMDRNKVNYTNILKL